MKPKVTIYILQSLDGFIAKNQNDNLSWGSSEDKQHFREETTKIGCMIMGSSTYKNMPEFAFKNRKTFVMTRNPNNLKQLPGVEFFSGNPREFLEKLGHQNLSEVAVVGGGKTNQLFLKEKLVDEIVVTIAPKIFGCGIAGFGEDFLGIELKLIEHKNMGPGEITLRYKVS